MPITIQPEPEEMTQKHHLPLEHCCFCGDRTGMWSIAKDVAVCTGCAEKHEEAEVPKKEEWFEQSKTKLRPFLA